MPSPPEEAPEAPPGLRVRAASRGDIPAIVDIFVASVPDEEQVGFGRPRSTSAFAYPERLAAAWRDPNLVGGEALYVAELGARIVATVSVEVHDDAVELVNIDVARDVRRRGIGTRVVHFVEERARALGKSAVTLGTSRNAAGVPWPSLPWWQSLGYRVTHEEENAWTRSIGPGVREIRLRKELR